MQTTETDQTTPAAAPIERKGVRVTAEDLATGKSESHVIADDYVLTSAGRCAVSHVNAYRKRDGTTTHVVTIVGIRR